MSNPNIAKDSPATWKPGQSGNPNGRPPKEWTWSGLIKDMMDASEEDGEPVKIKIARALRNKAYAGDVQAIKEIGDRIDGKPKQQTDITSNGKELTPLLVKFISDETDRNTS